MKPVTVALLYMLLGTSLACAQKGDDVEKGSPSAPKLTREYLLAHGFKELADFPGVFVREHVRLGDVARAIGVQLSDLRQPLNADNHNTVKTAEVRGVKVVFRAEVEHSDGRKHSLDNPDAMCSVDVVCRKPQREYLKTDSSIRLRIRSVEVPEDRADPLQVTVELAATGKKPVALFDSDFYVDLTGGNISPGRGFGYILPEGTPEKITISPSNPSVFKLGVPVGEAIGSLSPGKYAVRVGIGGHHKPRGRQSLDYQWQGKGYWSDEYKFIVRQHF